MRLHPEFKNLCGTFFTTVLFPLPLRQWLRSLLKRRIFECFHLWLLLSYLHCLLPRLWFLLLLIDFHPLRVLLVETFQCGLSFAATVRREATWLQTFRYDNNVTILTIIIPLQLFLHKPFRSYSASTYPADVPVILCYDSFRLSIFCADIRDCYSCCIESWVQWCFLQLWLFCSIC